MIKTQREKGGGESQADAEICPKHAHPRREDRSIPAGPGKGPRRRPIRPLCPPPGWGTGGTHPFSDREVGGVSPPPLGPGGQQMESRIVNYNTISRRLPPQPLIRLITIMSKRDVIHITGSK